MPLCNLVGRLFVAAFVLLALLPSDVRAESAAVRLRWRGTSDPSVAGYHVHVRPLDGNYGAPRDAGLPSALPDGTLSVVVGRLDPQKNYVFALSAYTAGGAESGLSNELTLKARRLRCAKDGDCVDSDACTDNERCEAGRCVTDPHVCTTGNSCNEAVCDANTGCLVHEMQDGEACTNGDPCVSGVCTAGSCVIPPEAQAVAGSHDLSATQFVVRRHRRGQMLAALGSFAAESFDPRATGAVVQILRADGGVLFQADAPGTSLRGRKRSWRWVRRGPTGGLRRLVLRWDGTFADVRLKAVLPSSAAAAGTALTWAVHTAGMCVRAPDLVCTESGRRLATCS